MTDPLDEAEVATRDRLENLLVPYCGATAFAKTTDDRIKEETDFTYRCTLAYRVRDSKRVIDIEGYWSAALESVWSSRFEVSRTARTVQKMPYQKERDRQRLDDEAYLEENRRLVLTAQICILRDWVFDKSIGITDEEILRCANKMLANIHRETNLMPGLRAMEDDIERGGIDNNYHQAARGIGEDPCEAPAGVHQR